MSKSFLIHEERYAPGEVALIVGDFLPGVGVELRKEFYLNGQCVSREHIHLPPEALDTLQATWMRICGEGGEGVSA